MNPVEKQEGCPTRSYKNDLKRDLRDVDYADDYDTYYEDEGTSDDLSYRDWE